MDSPKAGKRCQTELILMLEPLARANIERLQRLYDRFPSPARNILTSARGWFLKRNRYAPEMFSFFDKLRAHEKWSSDQIASFQLQSIRETVSHARAMVPYYAHYPQIEISSFDSLRLFPVLPRETVRENRHQFLSRDTPRRRRIFAGTTGTTGGSLRVAYTEELARKNWAFLLQQREWARVKPLGPRLTLFGARVVPTARTKPPFWTYNLPERQFLLSIFHLSQSTATDYIDFLHAHHGSVLEGFPSVLSILADFVVARGETVPMRVVFTTGEPLYPTSREKIEAAFQANIFDSYGMTEYCGLIQQCEYGEMHLAVEYGFLEILNDVDRPVSGDEEGYFVWTGFLNRAMPLVRYRIGDRGRWKSGSACRCGRASPRVIPTITRESEILRCPDGRIFSPRALNQFLKKATMLRSCQFIHEQPERVVVRAVASNSHAAQEMMDIRRDLQQLLGGTMRVTAEIATEPVIFPGGKIPLIVNRVSL
jgi:phenylacetate-CoA ligase